MIKYDYIAYVKNTENRYSMIDLSNGSEIFKTNKLSSFRMYLDIIGNCKITKIKKFTADFNCDETFFVLYIMIAKRQIKI